MFTVVAAIYENIVKKTIAVVTILCDSTITTA